MTLTHLVLFMNYGSIISDWQSPFPFPINAAIWKVIHKGMDFFSSSEIFVQGKIYFIVTKYLWV